jgi:hypothetical protein
MNAALTATANFVLVALVATSPLSAQPHLVGLETLDEKMDAWKICVVETSRRWATQNEPVDTIVDASIGRCRNILTDIRVTMADARWSDGTVVYTVPSIMDVTEKMVADWRGRAAAVVLEARSASSSR